MLRPVKYIVVHCTQTTPQVDAEIIRDAMKEDNRRPMYHGMVDRFGHFMRLMGCNLVADNRCPENEAAYHIAYVGGLNYNGQPHDTRNPVQHHALYEKLLELKELFPGAQLVGADHFAGDVTVNPGFDVTAWLDYYKDHREDWIEYEEPETEEGQWKSVG